MSYDARPTCALSVIRSLPPSGVPAARRPPEPISRSVGVADPAQYCAPRHSAVSDREDLSSIPRPPTPDPPLTHGAELLVTALHTVRPLLVVWLVLVAVSGLALLADSLGDYLGAHQLAVTAVVVSTVVLVAAVVVGRWVVTAGLLAAAV